MSKKIFLGLSNICNFIPTLKKAFEALGYTVVTALYSQSSFYHSNDSIILPPQGTLFPCGATLDYDNFTVPPSFEPIFDCDIFIFIAMCTLFPFYKDLPLLRKMGKQIIINTPGSDVRHHVQAKHFFEHYHIPFPKTLENKTRNTEHDLAKVARKEEDVYTKKVYKVRMAELYANTVVTSPGAAGLFLRPYHAGVIALDASCCRPYVPKREKPLVVHAPTWRSFKQTEIILQTVDRLHAEGILFDFVLLEKKSNVEVLNLLTKADVLIDQIYCGKSGLLGLEGLASGCCVLGCNQSEAQPIPYESQPIIGITDKNIYKRLKQVLMDKQLRIQYAEAGIEYIRLGIHDPIRVAKRFLHNLYRSTQGDYDYYPTLYVEHGDPPVGEVVPHEIKSMNWAVMQKYGVAPDFSPKFLFKEQLLPENVTPEQSLALPRWELNHHKRFYWGWWNKEIQYPYSASMSDDWKDGLSRLRPLAKKFENI